MAVGGRPLHRLDQVGEALLHIFRAAFGHDIGNGVLVLADVGAADSERVGPDNLDLAHGNAAGDLGAILGESRDEEQLFEFTELALALKVRGPHVHLAQGLHRRRQPGETMGGVLRGIDAASLLNALADARLGERQDAVGRGDDFAGPVDQALGIGGEAAGLWLELSDGHSRHPPEIVG